MALISFKFKVVLSNGDEAHLSAVGKDPDSAYNALMQVQQVKDFIGNKEITDVQCTGWEEYQVANPKDYVITPSQQKADHWLVADKANNLVVIFRNKAYKDTAKISFLDDRIKDTHQQAVIIRKIGEWLALNHEDKL